MNKNALTWVFAALRTDLDSIVSAENTYHDIPVRKNGRDERTSYYDIDHCPVNRA